MTDRGRRETKPEGHLYGRVSSSVLGYKFPWGQAVGSKHSVLVSPPGEGLGLGGSKPLRE